MDISKKTKPTTTKLDPPNSTINKIVSLYNGGRLLEVVKMTKDLTDKYPNSFTIWNFLGAASNGIGLNSQANLAFQKVTEINPTLPDGFNNLGVTLQNIGSLEKANQAYKKAIELNHNYTEAYTNLGNSLSQQKKINEAFQAYNKALSISPDHVETHMNLGILLKNTGQINEALKSYKHALSLNPNGQKIFNNIGNALQEQRKFPEAETAYKKAILIRPGYAEAHNNLGTCLEEQDKLEEAISAYKKAISLKPNYSNAYANMGNALKYQGKLDEALKAYRHAQLANPDNVEAYNSMANTLQDQGKIKKALEIYKQALAIQPDHATVIRHLSALENYKIGNPRLKLVKDLLCSPSVAKKEKCSLHYAYAKMNVDLAEFERAVNHYEKGGAIRKSELDYNIEQDRMLFDKIKKTSSVLKEFELQGNDDWIDNTPIFILGMPRSGTTLVEQIISSHSAVYGAGELNLMRQLGSASSKEGKNINHQKLIEIREQYFKKITEISNGKKFVTDKMPQNFLYIAVIFSVFPNAKVIHTSRSPAAVCWSNFTHYFSQNGLGYSYDLKDIVQYYNLYQDLMNFWTDIYGDRIYNLDYEELTLHQAVETKKMVHYLELDWQDACLFPHKNERIIQTASKRQVKEKVYSGSSKAWQKFEPFLNGIFDEIL